MRSIAPGASSRSEHHLKHAQIASTADSTSTTTSVLTSMPRHFTRDAGARAASSPPARPSARNAARLARQRDDIADEVPQQHRAAAMQMRDREHAALAVRQAAAGVRIDHLKIIEIEA